MRAFTVQQLREFRDLNTRLSNAMAQRMILNCQIAELEEKEAKIEAEIEEVTALLATDYMELSKADDLFAAGENPSDKELAEVQVEETSYVKKETKEKLLRKIFADYRKVDPKARTISYRHIKERLERDYNIECKSIANFFVGMLDRYETEGGNRNKAIVLPKI